MSNANLTLAVTLFALIVTLTLTSSDVLTWDELTVILFTDVRHSVSISVSYLVFFSYRTIKVTINWCLFFSYFEFQLQLTAITLHACLHVQKETM